LILSDESRGLLADEKVLRKYGCAIATASTGLYALDSEKVTQITEAPHDVLEQEISDSIKAGVDAVKIGTHISNILLANQN